MTTNSVIIPTYNRPDDLDRCLASITEQTLLPDEVLVIDDGDLPGLPHRERLEQLGVRCELRKKPQNEKGLTRSRNLGVELASGEHILFFDDDVELAPDYVEQIQVAYDNTDDPKLGGVGGFDLLTPSPTPLTYCEYFYNRLFLISPRRPYTISPSGFTELLPALRCFPPRQLSPADMLFGYSFSFHRRVFEKCRFAEHYTHGYCQGEDKEFTLRVSADFNLYFQPSARLRHFHSPAERVDKYRRGRDYVLAAHGLATTGRGRTALFFYSWVGHFLKRLATACVKHDRDEFLRVRGILDAAVMVLRGEDHAYKPKSQAP